MTQRPDMTNPVGALWLAGFVRRWHHHPIFVETDDRTHGHSARVLVLALAFRPNLSREAMIYAISHDFGEQKVGDMGYGFKADAPVEVIEALESAEDEHRVGLWGAVGVDSTVPVGVEYKLIDFCDRLDSYLWAQRFDAAYTAAHFEKLRRNLIEQADLLGLSSHLEGLIPC